MADALMPFIGSSFPLGQAAAFVESFEDDDVRAIAKAELAYFRGEPEQAYDLAKPYLESPKMGLRSSACFIVIYASLPLKRTSQANHCLSILERQMSHASPHDRPAAKFAYDAAYSLLHLHDGTPSGDAAAKPTAGANKTPQAAQARDVSPASGSAAAAVSVVEQSAHATETLGRSVPLSEGVRLFATYVAAHQAYLRGEYEFSLGLATGAISMATAVYPISFLYLYLIECMCEISLKRPVQARETFRKAWDIARADKLIQGIGEHHGLLGGLIESCIKESEPEAYKRIIAITYSFSKGWRMVHNPTTGEDVADNLSTTEFSIAMLLNKGWTTREVAAHLGVTENTVKTHVKSIYRKLGINNRKELGQFMLR